MSSFVFVVGEGQVLENYAHWLCKNVGSSP